MGVTSSRSRGGSEALAKAIQQRQVAMGEAWEELIAQPRARVQSRHLQATMASYIQQYPFWRALQARVVALPQAEDEAALAAMNLEEWLGDLNTEQRLALDAVMKAGPVVMAAALAAPAVTLLLQEGGTVDFRTAITVLGNAFTAVYLRVAHPDEEAAARDARSLATSSYVEGAAARHAGEDGKTSGADDDGDDADSSVSQTPPLPPLLVQPLFYGTLGELRRAQWWVDAVAAWVQYYRLRP